MLWKCAVVILALACVVGSAQADFKPRVSLAASGNTGAVVINGEIAVRFKVSNGGLSGLERARITTDRIIALVNSGFNPANLKVQGDKNAARIYAGDQLICIATANDAKALNSKPLDVANKWASQIRTFLLLPAIALSRNEVTVPLGENRQVDIKGAASGPVSVAIDDAEIAGVTVQPDGRQ